MSSDPCTYCPPPKPSVKSWQTHTRAPETFIRFPKLAPEIRIKIWRLAASEPREIKLYVLSPEWMDTKMKEQTRAPAIMHTCRESRCVECENHVPLSKSLIISIINFSYSYAILLLEYCWLLVCLGRKENISILFASKKHQICTVSGGHQQTPRRFLGQRALFGSILASIALSMSLVTTLLSDDTTK